MNTGAGVAEHLALVGWFVGVGLLAVWLHLSTRRGPSRRRALEVLRAAGSPPVPRARPAPVDARPEIPASIGAPLAAPVAAEQQAVAAGGHQDGQS
jgi:hypothetical protein